MTHTMDWKQFVEIMDGPHVLNAPVCDVFEPEKLVYLFYGRPCYKMHMGELSSSITSMDTVCILFNSESLPNPKRVYPFDSGAFHEGFYKDYIHPTDKKEQFEVPATLESAKNMIGTFFGDNLNYYKDKLATNITPKVTELDVITYMNLAGAKHKTRFDSRKSAIEYQIEGNIDLMSVDVLAVIANEDVFDDPDVSNFVNKVLRAKKIGYYSPHAQSEEEALLVMNKAKELYHSLGLL